MWKCVINYQNYTVTFPWITALKLRGVEVLIKKIKQVGSALQRAHGSDWCSTPV